MRFIAVHAWLERRYGACDGSAVAEFSWAGVNKATNAAAAAGSCSATPGASLATSSYHRR